MSGENKAVKAALKEAKDFITKKDFKSALRSCKKVINMDKNNYMAFVFCGLCLNEMQQPDQALQVKSNTPNFQMVGEIKSLRNDPDL